MAARQRVHVRREDGERTVISSRRNNRLAPLTRRKRVSTLAEARDVGLLPKFVDLRGLERTTLDVLADPAHARRADQQVRDDVAALKAAGRVGPATTEAYVQARISTQTRAFQADALAAQLEATLDPRSRLQIAGRAVATAANAPFDVSVLHLDNDLDVYSDLVFARDITVAEFAAVRIFRGATIIGEASTFIFRAASLKGDVLELHASETSIDINDLVHV